MTRSARTALGFLCAALAGPACGAAGSGKSGDEGDSAAVRGGPAMRLRLAAVDGGEIDLANYRGRAVILHLFNTDSAAAALDAEGLAELARRQPKRATVIGICLDPEGYPMAAAWRRALGLRYLIALSDENLRAGTSPLGRVRVIPTTVVLDRAGRIARRIERPLQPGEIENAVAALFEAP